jgi:hypothetical protein
MCRKGINHSLRARANTRTLRETDIAAISGDARSLGHSSHRDDRPTRLLLIQIDFSIRYLQAASVIYGTTSSLTFAIPRPTIPSLSAAE